MATTFRRTLALTSLTCWFALGGIATAADPPAAAGAPASNSPAADRAVRLPPAQSDVVIDMPEGDALAKCTIEVEKTPSTNGWIVRDGQGTVLRRFIDTNGNNQVDQWCYYRFGIEVYRDIDTNDNKIADQYRWLNTGGSRIGIDANEDKKVDSWQNISAEEVTAELVAALRDRDPVRFERLLLTAKEMQALGLGKAKADALAKKLELAKANFATALKQQKLISPQTKWVSFNASQPGTVPAGSEESTADVQVYENTAAMIDTEGKPQAINVGTIVKAGGNWRLIDAPLLGDDGVAEVEPREFFFRGERSEQPGIADAGKPSEEIQRLMDVLHKLGELTPQSTPEETDKRAEILEQLASKSEGEMRTAWYRQLADMLSAAVQTGTYPAGLEKLNALSEKLKTEPQDEELAFYVQFRGMTAEHGQALINPPNGDFAKIQTKWIEDLEKFVEASKKYPDSADAMLELAISQEFAGQDEQALKWYSSIVTDFPESPIHRKAAGAKTRLSAVGHSISLAGKLANNANAGNFDLASLKGKKVVLVQYWATWCEPCKSDMPLLKELRNKYKDFEVIGVNLDNNKQDMLAFLRENDPRWPQLYEDGGLESRYAVEMGIQTLPTMLLIDKQGKVVDRNIRAQGLEGEIQKLLK